ncbi:MAG: hypothetical protein GWN00_17585, partial [Aliifodinibius sp.]|nr:hypothetical protein [Fodinibius sp.]NIY26549.1 hypothetical protein [Fodinibius sp.]
MQLSTSTSNEQGVQRAVLGWRSNTLSGVNYVALYLGNPSVSSESFKTKTSYSPNWAVAASNSIGDTYLQVSGGSPALKSGEQFTING